MLFKRKRFSSFSRVFRLLVAEETEMWRNFQTFPLIKTSRCPYFALFFLRTWHRYIVIIEWRRGGRFWKLSGSRNLSFSWWWSGRLFR